jgi:NAD(P)H-quinone oxidoreductase subunit 5
MGFMVLQGGLGFVAAAVTHLILHGFYKAYLFLAAGSVVESTQPSEPAASRPGVLSGLVSLGAAAGGGLLFAMLTGKSRVPLLSGTLLVLFVVLAVLHATRAVVRRSALSATTRLWAVPALLLPTLGLYAAVYNGVKGLLGPLPATTTTELTALHWTIAGGFLLAYVSLERGWHRASTRLYVTLLNTSQPLPRTVLTQRDQYHAH